MYFCFYGINELQLDSVNLTKTHSCQLLNHQEVFLLLCFLKVIDPGCALVKNKIYKTNPTTFDF